MGLSDFSGGVQEALAEIIRDRLEREEVARRVEQQKFQNERALNTEGFRDRELNEGTRRFDLGYGIDKGNLDLRRDEFGLQNRQYEEGAPMRDASLAYTQAQTGDILRRPEAEQRDRDHDVSMTNLQGTWGLRTIGAQGAQQRMTQAAGSVGRAGAPDAGQAYAETRGTRIVDDIDALSGRVNNSTAGLIGALGKWVPGTAAHDFAADLETLAANISFKELQEMRNASKTGGALGQVAIRELELLESALGSLRQSQSPDQLKANLAKAREAITAGQQRWQAAKQGGAGGRSTGPGPGPAAPSAAVVEYDYVNGKLVPRGGGQ